MYRNYLTIYSDCSVGCPQNNKMNNVNNFSAVGVNNSNISVNRFSTGMKNVNYFESNALENSIFPNLPYSPFTSPNTSPEHKTHSISYSNSLSNLKEGALSISNFDNHGGITQVKQYHVSNQLGQGSYGLVQLAFNEENSTYYAMKTLSKKKLMKSNGLFNRPMPLRRPTTSISSTTEISSKPTIEPLQKIYKEIAIHKKLNHHNIVKLIEVLDDPSHPFLYMVFEYVENGAVMQIGKDGSFPESKARKYFIDALLGLEYLHYQKIIHRDIKPANLLLSKDDQIKIADFGVSNEFTGDDVFLTSTAGSPAFMAPESVQNREQAFTGKALDIWALGITLYAFLFAEIPFQNCNRFLLYQMIVNNPISYPSVPCVSGDVLNLLSQMLDKDPLSRIKLPEIKEHDWVTERGVSQIPTERSNCGVECIDVTDDEVANSIRQIPRIETVMKIKMLLKNKSFKSPPKYGSVSKLNITTESTNSDDPISSSNRPQRAPVTSVEEPRNCNENGPDGH